MSYRETGEYGVYTMEPGQTLDLVIDIGKSPSEIAADDPDVLYRQNCLYAGQDASRVYYPIGHVVKDGKLYQEYWRGYPWSAFMQPKTGRPYIGGFDFQDIANIELAFIGTPQLVMAGRNIASTAAVVEQTAPDIAQSVTYRTGIAIQVDGTIFHVTTKAKYSLSQFADLLISLGAWDALNLDGGGSTENDKDNYSGEYERPTSSALIVRRGKGSTMTKTVVIDPGHGAHDPGGVGNGMQEKDVVLTIAHKVAWYLLQGYEVNVTMTRTDDTFVELSKRDDVADTIPADYFVSIHCNAYDGKARGFESFVYPGHRSKQAGQMQDIIHDALAAYLKSLGMPDRGKQEKDLSVLRETDMPAVLIEYGFVDEADDAKLLQDSSFIEAVSKITADSIAQAMGLPAKQTQPEPPPAPPANYNWKQNIHDLARQHGLIDSDWSAKLDEPAPVWMVLKLALEAKGINVD